MTIKFRHFRFFLLLISCFAATPPAISANPANFKQLPVQNQYSGAASLDELSAALFSAIKANDFNLISKFFPGQAELKSLQKSNNKNLQALTENLTTEQIQGTFKTDFESLMQTTTEQMLNWAEHTLAETTPNQLQATQNVMAPIKLYVAAGEHAAPYYILYEAVRIKNRYYLFQHITLQKSG